MDEGRKEGDHVYQCSHCQHSLYEEEALQVVGKALFNELGQRVDAVQWRCPVCKTDASLVYTGWFPRPGDSRGNISLADWVRRYHKNN